MLYKLNEITKDVEADNFEVRKLPFAEEYHRLLEQTIFV